MKKQLHLFALLAVLASLGACQPAYKAAMAKFDQAEYTEAIPMLEDALSKSQHEHEKGKIHFYIAEAYWRSNRPTKAVEAYSKALSEKYYNDRIGLHYGLALKAMGEYARAKEQFESFTNKGADRELVRRAKLELQYMKTIDSLNNNPNPYVTVKNLSTINTEGADYAPAIWGDKIVYASTESGNKVYAATGMGFSDLFYAKLNTNGLGSDAYEPQLLSQVLNKKGFHEAAPTFSKDGNTIIFARSNPGGKDAEFDNVNLYEARRNGAEWNEAELMDFISNENRFDSSPAFSIDGKTLYFASDRDGGYGGTDLYYCTRDGGGWSRPKNLGKDINTPGDEMFPFVDAEGRLYFASDGHPGLGGLDLFEAVREEGIITIRNMGKPYNSPLDDFGLVKYGENNEGFFSSNRTGDGTKGGDDIYYFLDETPEIHIIHYLLAGQTFASEEGEGQDILPDVTLTLSDESGKEVEKIVSDADGKYQFKTELEMGKTYRLEGTRDRDYAKDDATIPTKNFAVDMSTVVAEDTTVIINQDLILNKTQLTVLLEEDAEIEITILYDLDKFFIRPDAAEELNKVVSFMKQYTDVKLELGSHTDVRGDDDYNQTLSENRAKSAVEYLVKNGIDKKRLVAKGYGETDLKIKDAKTEAEHQLNRRTTLKSLKN